MKFTKEEISLCKQVAEKCKKEIEYGDWFLRNDTKFEHTLFLRIDKDMIAGYIQGEIVVMDDMSNVDMKKAIPLWTISDCLEFLQEEEDVIELVITGKHLRWFCRWENREMRSGKTPLEACLKAVSTVLEDKE